MEIGFPWMAAGRRMERGWLDPVSAWKEISWVTSLTGLVCSLFSVVGIGIGSGSGGGIRVSSGGASSGCVFGVIIKTWVGLQR